MSKDHIHAGAVRKLLPTEWESFRDHLLRLDTASRRMRFAHAVSDSFIEDYASRMSEMGSIVFALIDHGQVRAAAELRKLGDTWGREAEAAFSVEKTFQDKGIGSELMGRVIRAARNRGVQHDQWVKSREGHSLRLIDALASRDVVLTLVKGGDHRLSGPADLDRLTQAVEELSG